MNTIYYYQTDIGKIGIVENGTAITNLYFYDVPAAKARVKETPLLKKAGDQLQEYLAGKRKTFELPLAPNGTEFQQKVWQALQEIPYGETRSYKEIARCISQSAACRAVGMANGKNPILIFIPCHRVIEANGGLAGYAAGVEVKKYLLNLEAKNK